MYVTTSELSLSTKYHIISTWKQSDNLSTIIKQMKPCVCWMNTLKKTRQTMKRTTCGEMHTVKSETSAQALNNYLTAMELNPDSPAQTAYNAQIKILDFYNKDMYNH